MGLWRIGPAAVRRLGADSGLPRGQLLSLEIDRKGDLWIASNAGLYHGQRARLDAYLADAMAPAPFARVDTSEFNGSACPSASTPDGRLWFASAIGVLVVDPERVATEPVRLAARVDRIAADGVTAPRSGWDHLGPGVDRVRIDYAAPHLGGRGPVTFRHRLRGRDREWQESSLRSVEYRGLPPGDYTFELTARVGDGPWPEPVAVELALAAPWYQTPWARGGAVLLVLAAVSGAALERARRTRAQQRHLLLLVDERTSELRAIQHELVSAKEAAEAASVAKTRFLATMSHELRTPLNAIIGYSEMLEEDAVGQDGMVADLRKIHGAGKHLLTLINDMLDLSKIEAGKMELRLESFEVARLVAEVAETVTPLVQARRNRLEVDCPPETGTMLSDAMRVRQVLLNLLSNAAKFSENGSIALTVTRRRLPGGDTMTFAVTDTGIGMSAEQLARLFQPFAQADESTTRKYGGTGLGLAISRRVCQLLGGEIAVTSEPGRGTAFTVTVPASAPMPDVAPPPPGAPSVLVIDDDADARDLIARVLRKQEIHVLQAVNGEAGLELARRMKPDLITLDVLLPGMDGWAVLSQLKADVDLARIPVVMVTVVDQRLGAAFGVADHMTKPIDGERLLAIVRRHFHGPGHVLVVDDDPADRDLLAQVLGRRGLEVRTAENGRIALDCVASARPALVVLDLSMPVMDGFELMVALRADPKTAGIPVVVVTGKSLSGEERARLAGEVEHVVRKGGLDTDDLCREVIRLLGPRRKP
jgi:signal transduction histidine kinase/DNA-binding response OmpR family regulator